MPALRWAIATALVLTVPLRAQTTSPNTGPQAAAGASEAVTLTGCLQTDPKGSGYVLTEVKPSTAGTKDSPLTSAGAGTSATGDAPSGTVTGDTPTGSTATTTSAPTPAAGTSGSSANPASPGYNQGDVSAGTTGTVPRPEKAESAPIQSYRLVASAGVALDSHTGHTVEIRGVLKPTTATPPTRDTGGMADERRGSATAEPTKRMREPIVEAQSVRHVAAGCPR